MMRSVVHVTLPGQNSAWPSMDEAHGHTGGQFQSPSKPNVGSDPGSSVWQLVTAHSNGQLQVWDPSLGSIQPVLRIGDPGSACRYATHLF